MNAPQTKNDLSIQGGNENVRYFISGGFLTQESQLKSGDMDYERYNLRVLAETNLKMVRTGTANQR